jgi:hypothetical protein
VAEIISTETGLNEPAFNGNHCQPHQFTAAFCLVYHCSMKPLLQLENALRTVLEVSQQHDIAETLASLRRAEPSCDSGLASTASRIVDLASEVVQLLEPAHLVLADHLFGMTNHLPVQGRN